jgi:hypothetical protein
VNQENKQRRNESTASVIAREKKIEEGIREEKRKEREDSRKMNAMDRWSQTKCQR